MDHVYLYRWGNCTFLVKFKCKCDTFLWFLFNRKLIVHISIVTETWWFHFTFFCLFVSSRPPRAKMRFWAKGKQGEKKTTRAKSDIQTEVSALYSGSNMIPAHQYSDGKNGLRMGIVYIICLLYLKFAVPLILIITVLLVDI